MEILIWLAVYLIFVIISTVLTAKRPRKEPPPPRREPPIIIKPAPTTKPSREAVLPVTTVAEEEAEKESIVIKERGGLIDALPFTPDRVINGIIYSQILSPPARFRFISRRSPIRKTTSRK